MLKYKIPQIVTLTLEKVYATGPDLLLFPQ